MTNHHILVIGNNYNIYHDLIYLSARNISLPVIKKKKTNFRESNAISNKTPDFIPCLEKKVISRFNVLDKEMLNLKDIITENV